MMIMPAETPTPMPAFAPVPSLADGNGEALVIVAGELGTELLEAENVIMGVVVAGIEGDDVERCWVAVLAEETMVVKGFPVPDSRNLPTPLLQQSVVWSQQ